MGGALCGVLAPRGRVGWTYLLRVDERRDQRPLADCGLTGLDGRVEERGSAEGRRRAAVGGGRGRRNWGPRAQ